MTEGGAAEVEIGEGAIDKDVGGRAASSAGFALEEGDPGGVKVAPGDPTSVGEDFAVGIEAAVEAKFDLIEGGNAGEAAGGGSGFDAGDGADGVEGGVDAAGKGAHVGGFVPGAANLEGEDVGGVEAGVDAAELLQAAEQ